jgi:phosphoglycolate phosphatase-like HAD superfamily hydrolase
VACGRAIGANVLAVRTGFARPGELESAKPDLLVEDLASLPDESALWE